jgi:3-dehydroquinate synthase
MRLLRVKCRASSYEVRVGCGAWRALREVSGHSSVFLLSERGLWNRWGKRFIRESGLRSAQQIFVAEGEASKSLRMLEAVVARLSDRGADRRSLLVTFGGGVIGDLGGFVASTYMRGIDYIQVPTTVVAQVDSAIGGKTGVNVGRAKNLVGTFYPPRMVLSDPRVLSSLEPRVFRSGLYEVVKHAILAGSAFFDKLAASIESLRPDDASSLEPLLARAAQVKVDVVSRDEREAGLRRVLNLGHTLGHALEEATAYRRFLHGEAVGWGLLGVTRLAERLGVMDLGEGNRMAELVHRVGPLPPIRDLPGARVLGLLSRDKKAIGGKIHWVIPERVGKVRITSDVPMHTVAGAFRDIQRDVRHA